MPQASFDAVCERMIAHSKAVGNAPRQEAIDVNSVRFSATWLDCTPSGAVFAQRAAGSVGAEWRLTH
ncbi:hypothetical protein [Streptomyces sp. NPDC017413]|uniref:hypothetical protein n=1 Tax=unclassified Streptomyces TaxID=2593676 RepID=UPI0037A76A2A